MCCRWHIAICYLVGVATAAAFGVVVAATAAAAVLGSIASDVGGSRSAGGTAAGGSRIYRWSKSRRNSPTIVLGIAKSNHRVFGWIPMNFWRT